MASNGRWVVVFDDKKITKKYDEGAEEGAGHVLKDDPIWNEEKFANIWAIQYETSVPTDTVEYRDETPHSTYDPAVLGDFKSQFIDRWDAAQLVSLQNDWDNDNEEGESSSEKISRLGARPTSYTSNP